MDSQALHSYDLTIHFDLDLLQLHQLEPDRYPYLLESVAQGGNGRYDILMALPQEKLVLDAKQQITYQASSQTSQILQAQSNNFLDEFDRWYLSQQTSLSLPDLPFIGGWFVYLGYELAQQIEPSLVLPDVNNEFPIAFATRIPAALIKDHHSRQLTLVIEASHAASHQLIIQDLEKSLAHEGSGGFERSGIDLSELEEEEPGVYLESVKRIKQYIRDGDVFQVNLSRQWKATVKNNDYISVYQHLRQQNPAPFFGLMKFNDSVILSSSPERLVRLVGDTIETRPIAGTRPTAKYREDDHAFQAELMAHPKERAEHVMLIDLERNDLGRVCLHGSIEVDELMVLESYAHVHHIVSNVKGRIKNNIRPADIIKAVFPGGTITGCPKVRCMQIIAELEKQARGPYTGSFGYINTNGNLDLNILIRTMSMREHNLSLRAGAGIVADSDPENELQETRAKAKGLLLALGLS